MQYAWLILKVNFFSKLPDVDSLANRLAKRKRQIYPVDYRKNKRLKTPHIKEFLDLTIDEDSEPTHGATSNQWLGTHFKHFY